MKARIVLAGLLVSMLVVEVSAQRAEYDDMYFRGKDREKNKAIDAEESFSAKNKTTQQKEEDFVPQEEDNANPTDSYSSRNVNPEYVSRENSEQASEDEGNYYLEGYTPASSNSNFSNNNFNNSYYNNANWARSSYYATPGWGNSPYYGGYGYNDPWMSPYSSPYYGGGYFDPWMTPSYGFGPSYGWRTGWSVSLGYGSYWNPYGGFGYGNPYYGGYGGYGYGYQNYYNGGNNERANVNYGKRPSRHSAVVRPTQRTVTRTRTPMSENNNSSIVNSRTRTRQTQDEYYVRPSRRTSNSVFDNSTQGSRSGNSFWTPNNNSSQPSRTRDSYNPPRESRSPSYTPSPSPSRGNSGGSSGNGGGGSPRPRGRN